MSIGSEGIASFIQKGSSSEFNVVANIILFSLTAPVTYYIQVKKKQPLIKLANEAYANKERQYPTQPIEPLLDTISILKRDRSSLLDSGV